MRAKSVIIGLLLLLLILQASAVSIGTAPGVYDLGELDPGKNVAFRFYLMTNSKNDLLLTLTYVPVHQDMYTKSETGRYDFVHTGASQEDISSWVEIPRNPLLLSPDNVKVVYLSTGGAVKANEEADIVLHIPEDADPGYHAGSISLTPRVASSTGGTGVTTIAVTRFVFVFRVAGEAVRDGEIMTIVADRVGDEKAQLDVLFKNTGSCTINARVKQLTLYDKFGNNVATIHSGVRSVRPGLIESLTSYWGGSDVKPGIYRAEAVVDYITGYDSMEAQVEIPTKITVKPSGPSKPKTPEPSLCAYMPYAIMLLVIAGLFVYLSDWRERGTIVLVLGALAAIILLVYILTCVFVLAFTWLDILFILIILALIIYWRTS